LADKWIVLKFGGTSVAGRPQWEVITSLVKARQSEGFRVLLVCSAVAGVTSRLDALADVPDSVEMRQEVMEIHRVLGRKLDVDDSLWLDQAERQVSRCLQDLAGNPGPRSRAALLAMGEWMSTTIGSLFLRQTLAADWVDVRDVLEVAPEKDLSPARRWLSAACSAGEDPCLAGLWSELNPVVITQGFIARTREGETALLGRGGSDTSAAILAGRLAAERLEIWTDVPGLFSADPRLIKEARLLIEVSYDEALEMAASGARVIHGQCIRAAAVTGTPVVIRDLNRRSVPGTRIGEGVSETAGIKTVTCQENMAVLLLQNLDMRHQVGFLAEVFGIFRRSGLSIDLVATSETTTTVAINCKANHLGQEELQALVTALGEKCKVKLFDNCVCVNLVGRGARTALSRIQQVMRHFEDRPLLMASQSANDLCFSLLVNAGDHEKLLQGAHRCLIPQGDRNPAGVFGASWTMIRRMS
jgi:diaminopimelate decarboxylase/aspartate kinase